ncbi:enoyl-CoA hydratase/isomerase family protein [Rhodococcus sp. SGAir0479]|uniref:enoyl-CoA hydratase/isomerase family protein n=1 Tax=Rhodococcus sp. SGAir0479 TaxID=2567884 RepID=UPI0010CCF1C0|nr:enoyl-CoA hydratase-related protein [Rhodococcus sp. SGAir0479]QCQ91825.1 enoyl-CoA hydratase/isomerase family protein [Rhodococcus sp. SGAir0479]
MTATDAPSNVRIEDGVLRVAVATAANGTSLDIEGITQATAALREAGDDVRAVLLVGDGANFCAGGNVRAFASAENRGEFVGEIARAFHEFVRALDETSAPVVAAVHGWAAGAGMSIVCLADIAIGGTSTKLRPAYPSIGFTPDGGMSWTLPRIVGASRAREILLTDAVLNSDEACRLGLLSRLVEDDQVQDEALRLARMLAAGPTASYAGIKALFVSSRTNTLSEQLDAETASISAAADGATGREGVDAFVEKRRPDFSSVRDA